MTCLLLLLCKKQSLLLSTTPGRSLKRMNNPHINILFQTLKIYQFLNFSIRLYKYPYE